MNKEINSKLKTNLPILIGLFFIPISFFPFISNSFTSTKAGIFSIIGIACFITLITKKKLVSTTSYLCKNNRIFLILFLSLILSLISSLFNPHIELSLLGNFSRNMGLIHHIFGIFIVLYIATKYKQTPLQFKIISISNFLLITYGILQSLNIELFFSNYNFNLFAGRIFSLIGNPSYFGQFLTILIGLNIYKIYNLKSHKWKIFELILIIGNLYCLILSQTRTALLGIVFFTIILSLLKFKAHIKKIILAIASLICIAFFVFPNRFSINDTAIRSLNTRLHIWGKTIELISKKPILGYGNQTFTLYSPSILTPEYLTQEASIDLIIDKVHNQFLEKIYENGFLQGLFYLALIFYLFKYVFFHKNPNVKILSLILLTNIFQNQFGFNDFSLQFYEYFLFGLLIHTLNQPNKLSNTNSHTFLKSCILGTLLYFLVLSQLLGMYHHRQFKINAKTNPPLAIESLNKSALFWPYYSQVYYEMLQNKLNTKFALQKLVKIEGETPNILAWQGNIYRDNLELSTKYYLKALEFNPYHPNIVRAFADTLYYHQDYEMSLYMYKQYLKSIPAIWNINTTTSKENEKYYGDIIKKYPYLNDVSRRIDELIEINNQTTKDNKTL